MFDFTPIEPLEQHEQVLMDAAQIVRSRWRQGHFGQDGEPRCAMGAIWEASDKNMVHEKGPTHLLLFYLDRSIPDWNDTPGRTADEVASAMESAAMARCRALVEAG